MHLYNSADADLYRLLFRDLNTGKIVRPFRQTGYTMKSAKMPILVMFDRLAPLN
jgi:hypothetical protein